MSGILEMNIQHSELLGAIPLGKIRVLMGVTVQDRPWVSLVGDFDEVRSARKAICRSRRTGALYQAFDDHRKLVPEASA
jgi:hypothetical protein